MLREFTGSSIFHDALLDVNGILWNGGFSTFGVHTALLSEFFQGFDAVQPLQFGQDHSGWNAPLACNEHLQIRKIDGNFIEIKKFASSFPLRFSFYKLSFFYPLQRQEW